MIILLSWTMSIFIFFSFIEQTRFELEGDVVRLKQLLEVETKARTEYESKSLAAQDKLSDLEKEVQQLNTRNSTLQCQLQM